MNHSNNIFKNSGIRGKAVSHITLWHRIKNVFSPDKTTFFILRYVNALSIALAYYFHKQNLYRPCNIIIATDTRTSGKWISQNIQNNLLVYQHNVFNIGIAPTPFVSKAVTQYKPEGTNFFDYGIMVTASHNPAEYNGLKIFTQNGYLTEQEELEISAIFYDVQKNYLQYAPNNSNLFAFSILKNKPQKFKAFEFYMHHLKKDINNPQFKGLKVVIDTANGATYQIAEKIFDYYGFNTVMINNQPNGTNSNLDARCSNPALLADDVSAHNADWGLAFDGDGDRVIIADKHGQIFDGDDIIAILMQHPKFAKEQTVVGTIMTNEAVALAIKQLGKTFIRTDVGERNIINELRLRNAQLGSESCGHITIMKHALCSDGIYAALMFLDTIYSGKTITTNSYAKFAQFHDSITLEHNTISDERIEQIKNKYATVCKPGRIIIRKSNTEPVLRITTEHFDSTQAQSILNSIKKEFIAK